MTPERQMQEMLLKLKHYSDNPPTRKKDLKVIDSDSESDMAIEG